MQTRHLTIDEHVTDDELTIHLADLLACDVSEGYGDRSVLDVAIADFGRHGAHATA